MIENTNNLIKLRFVGHVASRPEPKSRQFIIGVTPETFAKMKVQPYPRAMMATVLDAKKIGSHVTGQTKMFLNPYNEFHLHMCPTFILDN